MDPCVSHLGILTSSKYGWNESVDVQTLEIKFSFLSKKVLFLMAPQRKKLCALFGDVVNDSGQMSSHSWLSQKSSQHDFHFPHQIFGLPS